MPLQSILEVEAFNCWGVDFMGPFTSSYSKEYILLVMDYVNKWMKEMVVLHADVKIILRFPKKTYFQCLAHQGY